MSVLKHYRNGLIRHTLGINKFKGTQWGEYTYLGIQGNLYIYVRKYMPCSLD